MKKDITHPVLYTLLFLAITIIMSMPALASDNQEVDENIKPEKYIYNVQTETGLSGDATALHYKQDSRIALLKPNTLSNQIENSVSKLDISATTIAGKVLETKYLTIIYENDQLLHDFHASIRKRGVSVPSDRKSSETLAEEAKNTVNALVENVEMILDMYPPSLKASIKLLPSNSDVQKIYMDKYNKESDFVAFYSTGDKTIYVSVSDILVRILAHELAHAVIDHYFEVTPPVKIHEVLAQYVEREL